MDESALDAVVFLNLGVIHVAVAALVYRYRDRLSGATTRETTTIPTDCAAWRVEADAIVGKIEATCEAADDASDDDPRRDLATLSARLGRLVRDHPDGLDDDVLRRLHDFELTCRDVSLHRRGRADPALALDRLGDQCAALRERLDVTRADGEPVNGHARTS